MLFFIYLTMKTQDNLRQVIACLPFAIKSLIRSLPSGITEIRLRSQRPVAFVTDRDTLYLRADGSFTQSVTRDCIALTSKELRECFNTICNYSVYSKQNEIVNGFVTLKGGNRAGICGTAVGDGGRITNIRDITSINLRVASERLGCSDEILSLITEPEKGFLLCGAPRSGKTTILRDLARALSERFSVSLIDCRGELAASYGGVIQNDVGMCDVLDGYTKRDGFDHALRCMSPDIIICDEIGDEADMTAINVAALSGVGVIASAHCREKDELLLNSRFKQAVKNRLFAHYVFLKNKENVGQVAEVISADELA